MSSDCASRLTAYAHRATGRSQESEVRSGSPVNSVAATTIDRGFVNPGKKPAVRKTLIVAAFILR